MKKITMVVGAIIPILTGSLAVYETIKTGSSWLALILAFFCGASLMVFITNLMGRLIVKAWRQQFEKRQADAVERNEAIMTLLADMLPAGDVELLKMKLDLK